jgi:hypothetical protein
MTWDLAIRLNNNLGSFLSHLSYSSGVELLTQNSTPVRPLDTAKASSSK